MIPLSPDVVDQFADAFVAGGRALQGRMQGVADSLFGSLLLLTFSWFGVNALLESLAGEQLGALLARLLRFLMLAGLVAWFLQAYDLVFYQGIYQGCEALASAVAGPEGGKRGFASAWNIFVDILLAVWGLLEATPGRLLADSPALSWAFLGGVMACAFTALLLFAALCVFTAALIILAVIHVMGSALTGIALALGPFFIPWLLWEPTQLLFTGWLKFLFTACFYRVVAVAVLVLTKPVLSQLHTLVTDSAATVGASPAASPVEMFTLAVVLVVLASIIASLMSHVPQIAGALIGHARVDTGFARGAASVLQSRTGHAGALIERGLRQGFGSAGRYRRDGRSGAYRGGSQR